MKLSKLGLLALRDRELKRMVAESLGVSENTIYDWIRKESDNLTKAMVLEVISRETGLKKDQLLEEELESKIAS